MMCQSAYISQELRTAAKIAAAHKGLTIQSAELSAEYPEKRQYQH